MVKVLKRWLNYIRKPYRQYMNRRLSHGKVKYFVIGRNKTGTTSLKKAFEEFNFPVGDQLTAEGLADKSYFESDFDDIIKYCNGAQVFQDVPFSWPETYKYVDKVFPHSKFILSIRDPEKWYKSITMFHTKLFGENGRLPTVQNLKDSHHLVRKGFMYNLVKVYGTPDSDPYNKKIMIENYKKHNEEVISYFKSRPKDLLVVDVTSGSQAYQSFCKFIGVKGERDCFSWENKT